MRVVIVTQDDAFYIGRFFKTFLAEKDPWLQIQAAVVCRTMGKKPRALLKQLHDFYGSFDLARMLSRYAATKLMARTVGALSRRHPFSLSQIFGSHGIEVIPSKNVNSRALAERLRSINLDLILSVAAPQVFKKRILSIPRIACVNIHTAELPKYRGMMPNFWAMYHGERQSAITVHTMDVEIDRGDMILQKKFDLTPGESLDALIKRSKVLAARCFIEALRTIRQDGIVPISPPDVEPSYFSFPTKEQVREFRRQGKRLL
jgi:methionyl-tRNA formyltransferase